MRTKSINFVPLGVGMGGIVCKARLVKGAPSRQWELWVTKCKNALVYTGVTVLV